MGIAGCSGSLLAPVSPHLRGQVAWGWRGGEGGEGPSRATSSFIGPRGPYLLATGKCASLKLGDCLPWGNTALDGGSGMERGEEAGRQAGRGQMPPPSHFWAPNCSPRCCCFGGKNCPRSLSSVFACAIGPSCSLPTEAFSYCAQLEISGKDNHCAVLGYVSWPVSAPSPQKSNCADVMMSVQSLPAQPIGSAKHGSVGGSCLPNPEPFLMQSEQSRTAELCQESLGGWVEGGGQDK